MFRSHGTDLDLSFWIQYIGWGTWNFDVCGHLEDLTGRVVDRDSLVPQRRQRYLDAVNANPVMPGVMERLDEARALNLRLGRRIQFLPPLGRRSPGKVGASACFWLRQDL